MRVTYVGGDGGALVKVSISIFLDALVGNFVGIHVGIFLGGILVVIVGAFRGAAVLIMVGILDVAAAIGFSAVRDGDIVGTLLVAFVVRW